MDLGIRIRKIRLEQNRTLQDIADSCGFTKSLLSKIETGKTVPAVATLVKIAEKLGVSVSVLLDDNDNNGTVYTPQSVIERKGMITTEKGYSFFPIAVERREKMMQPFLFIAKKGQIKTNGLSHEGEEFIYIMKGKIAYKVGEEEYLLQPGDSLYFNSIQSHELIPISEEVHYLAVFTK
jgi:transcriptional regulator with XRE-family HTH domain